jgi:Zn-dependent protease
MLLFNTDLLLDHPMTFGLLMAVVATALVASVTVHEAAHAAAAKLQGDLTAARLGRITLNPLAQLDRAGTVMLVLAGFGWGKPVPVNQAQLRNGRLGLAFVSAAGPFANVILALLFASLFRAGVLSADNAILTTAGPGTFGEWVTLVALFGVQLNILLAVFNLLPIPPLDGMGILAGLAPRRWEPAIDKVQQVGVIVMLVLVAIAVIAEPAAVGALFEPARDLTDALVG